MWDYRKIGFVQQTESLSFLAVLEVGGHLRLVELGQITIVQGLRGLGVPGQLLELRLDLRAGLDAPLVGMDLLVELSLFGTLGLDTDVAARMRARRSWTAAESLRPESVLEAADDGVAGVCAILRRRSAILRLISISPGSWRYSAR